MKLHQVIPGLLTMAVLPWGPAGALAQAPAGTGSTTNASPSAPVSKPGQAQPGKTATYVKPDFDQRFHNYLFDSFGPYAILGSVAAAGISQAKNTPPDWGQGWGPFGQRVGSKFGVNLVATTTRYGLAEVFREDTIYYRCECSGFFPRLSHALVSTITARRGEDGHRTISFSNIAAPYAGTETAALGWYPGRYDAMDGFRMGNYLLLAYGGLNIAKEFVYGGPHTLVKNVPLFGNHN